MVMRMVVVVVESERELEDERFGAKTWCQKSDVKRFGLKSLLVAVS